MRLIAGTSAGGINGALLATAIARNSPLPPLRDTWITLARYEEGLLIKAPTSRVRSILDGGFFLARLRETFIAIRPDGKTERASLDLTLFMTGTALVGDHAEYIDENRQRFTATDHRVCFAFRRNSERDDFCDENDEHHASRRLARAARAMASFPAAFEPIFVNNTGIADLPADSPLQ
jgi:predicted acylesterase/phospholipase RssA